MSDSSPTTNLVSGGCVLQISHCQLLVKKIICTVDEGESSTLEYSQVVFISDYIWLKYLVESKYFSEISASQPNRSSGLDFDCNWNEIEAKWGRPGQLTLLPDWRGGGGEDREVDTSPVCWLIWAPDKSDLGESTFRPASNSGGWLDNRQVAVAVALLISFRFKTQSQSVKWSDLRLVQQLLVTSHQIKLSSLIIRL